MIKEELKKAINLKSHRELLEHRKSPREMILDYITLQGSSTISSISENLEMVPKKVRYEALRLVQQHKLEMKVQPDYEEPLFTLMCE